MHPRAICYTLYYMRKIVIIIVVLVLAYVAYRAVQKKEITPSPEREAKCKAFITVATFPSGAAADAFLARCMTGEPVLPEDQPLE